MAKKKKRRCFLERLVHQVRELSESELSEMAIDPDIQAEIIAIDQEFAATEMDGLQN